MPQLAPFVYQSTTSTGTGNLALQAETGFREAADAFGTGSGNTFGYYVRHPAKDDEWEYGTGYVNTSGELVRSSVNVSSAGAGMAVSFSSGTKIVTADVELGELDTAISHPTNTSNPHSVTASQVGAISSIDGVSNAGGDVDLVAGGDVSLSPDDANNQVTISVTVPVDSVAGKTGAVSLNSGDVGLANVPNEDATDPANWGPAKTNGNFLVGNGSTFVAESGATARTSLGLGTAATKSVGTGSTSVPQNSDLGTQAYNDQHIATSSQNTNNGDVTYVV